MLFRNMKSQKIRFLRCFLWVKAGIFVLRLAALDGDFNSEAVFIQPTYCYDRVRRFPW
jgi:hypothetical protein